MKAFMIILCLVVLIGCQSTMEAIVPELANVGHGAKISDDTDNYTPDRVRIEYKPHSLLVQEIEEKAKVQIWDEKRKAALINILPPGGEIIVYLRRPTIDSGNTKWFDVALLKNNKIISRTEGKARVPNPYTSQYGSYWHNIMIVPIPQQMTTSFRVFVIDKLLNKRHEFTVSNL